MNQHSTYSNTIKIIVICLLGVPFTVVIDIWLRNTANISPDPIITSIIAVIPTLAVLIYVLQLVRNGKLQCG